MRRYDKNGASQFLRILLKQQSNKAKNENYKNLKPKFVR